MNSLINKDWFIALISVVYAITFLIIMRRNELRRRRSKERLQAAIVSGIKGGTIETLDDLVNVYKGVHNLAGDDTSYRSGLARALRSQLASLSHGLLWFGPVDENREKVEADRRRDLKVKLTSFLKQIEIENPFVDLPAAERSILADAKEMIAGGLKDHAQKKLDELGALIQVRHDAMQRLTSLNRWSTPLAVIGLVLTLIFGLVPIIPFFRG